ncbi:MAG: hypothetical protein ACPLW8_07065, partial [Candidatus Bathyarchaeales archaeon]
MEKRGLQMLGGGWRGGRRLALEDENVKEFFHINQLSLKRFDHSTGKFIVNIAYETAAPEPSERVVGVAEAFGLGLDRWEKFVIYDNVELKIGP